MLVTHQLQYLPAADEVVVLRDGRVAERGTYRQLLARGVDFHQFEQEVRGVGWLALHTRLNRTMG